MASKQALPCAPDTNFATELTGCSSASADTAFEPASVTRRGIERSGSVTSVAKAGRQAGKLCSGVKRSLDTLGAGPSSPAKKAKEEIDLQCIEESDGWSLGSSPTGHSRQAAFDYSQTAETISEVAWVSGLGAVPPQMACQRHSYEQERWNNCNPAACAPACPPLPLYPPEPERATSHRGPPETFSELQEIMRHMLKAQEQGQLRPNPQYMQHHTAVYQPAQYISPHMREMAVSWLVEVAQEYELHQETLFLAASLLDRFLSSSKAIPRTALQLISVACLLVAAKYEEEEYPGIRDFTAISDNCFTGNDLLKMESLVLDRLAFRITAPTTFTFFSVLKQGMQLEPEVAALASYFTELSMLDYEFLVFLPSELAAASILLAQAHFTGAYLPAADHILGLTDLPACELTECLGELLELNCRAYTADPVTSPFGAIRLKYIDPKWYSVASLKPLTKLPSTRLQSPH